MDILTTSHVAEAVASYKLGPVPRRRNCQASNSPTITATIVYLTLRTRVLCYGLGRLLDDQNALIVLGTNARSLDRHGDTA